MWQQEDPRKSGIILYSINPRLVVVCESNIHTFFKLPVNACNCLSFSFYFGVLTYNWFINDTIAGGVSVLEL
jgi:hypothetical protein